MRSRYGSYATSRMKRGGRGARFDAITMEEYHRRRSVPKPPPPVEPAAADPLEELGPYEKRSAEARLAERYEPTDFVAECNTIRPSGGTQRRTCIEHEERDCLCDVDLSLSPWDGTVAKRWATPIAEDIATVASLESGHGRDPYVFFQHMSALLLLTDADERRRVYQRTLRSREHWL